MRLTYSPFVIMFWIWVSTPFAMVVFGSGPPLHPDDDIFEKENKAAAASRLSSDSERLASLGIVIGVETPERTVEHHPPTHPPHHTEPDHKETEDKIRLYRTVSNHRILVSSDAQTPSRPETNLVQQGNVTTSASVGESSRPPRRPFPTQPFYPTSMMAFQKGEYYDAILRAIQELSKFSLSDDERMIRQAIMGLSYIKNGSKEQGMDKLIQLYEKNAILMLPDYLEEVYYHLAFHYYTQKNYTVVIDILEPLKIPTIQKFPIQIQANIFYMLGDSYRCSCEFHAAYNAFCECQKYIDQEIDRWGKDLNPSAVKRKLRKIFSDEIIYLAPLHQIFLYAHEKQKDDEMINHMDPWDWAISIYEDHILLNPRWHPSLLNVCWDYIIFIFDAQKNNSSKAEEYKQKKELIANANQILQKSLQEVRSFKPLAHTILEETEEDLKAEHDDPESIPSQTPGNPTPSPSDNGNNN